MSWFHDSIKPLAFCSYKSHKLLKSFWPEPLRQQIRQQTAPKLPNSKLLLAKAGTKMHHVAGAAHSWMGYVLRGAFRGRGEAPENRGESGEYRGESREYRGESRDGQGESRRMKAGDWFKRRKNRGNEPRIEEGSRRIEENRGRGPENRGESRAARPAPPSPAPPMATPGRRAANEFQRIFCPATLFSGIC